MLRAGGLAAVVMLGSGGAVAEVQARFIDGHYAMSAAACDKLKAIMAGAPRNITSVPWSVSAKGFDHGEGGCAFQRVVARKGGRAWTVVARCEEHGERRTTESYLFTRTGPDTFSVRLTTRGTSKADARPVTYTRCNVGAANAK